MANAYESFEGQAIKRTAGSISLCLHSAFEQDPEAEDATQILRTLAVHRHCGSALRVIVELLKPERRANAIWDDATSDIEIICFESIRFKLLSRRYMSIICKMLPVYTSLQNV